MQPFDKIDKIAILMKIAPEYRKDYEYLYKYYSIEDLNYLIRYEVYKNAIEDMNK
jgi:hypothetical protein